MSNVFIHRSSIHVTDKRLFKVTCTDIEIFSDALKLTNFDVCYIRRSYLHIIIFKIDKTLKVLFINLRDLVLRLIEVTSI